MLEPLTLTDEEVRSLRRQARRAVGRVSERIHYVLLFARGHTPPAIAALYEVDERTICAWLERFRAGGLGALDDLPRSGRPRLATVAAQIEAAAQLAGAPEVSGHQRSTWTRALLRRHLGERLDCWLSPSSVARLITRLGFVWTRPKLTTRRDDPLAEARRQHAQALLDAYPDAPCLYMDECDVHQLPVVRGQYQRRGEQREIPTPGTNRKQGVFGFLNVRTGQWHFWLPARKRSREFLTCLHELERRYPAGPILLFLDNASIHTSRVTRRWLSNHPRFKLAFLPAYSGHQTNPVEKVWWELKGTQFADAMYASLEAVQDAIYAFFASFSCGRALRLVARHDGQSAGWPHTPTPATQLQ